MANVRRVVNCCIYSGYKLIHQPRFIACILLMYVYMDSLLEPLRLFLREKEASVNGWGMYACLSSDCLFVLITSLLMLFIFSDAPFYDQAQQYIMLRSKRTPWVIGQFLYVAAGAFAFQVVTGLVMGLALIRHIEFGQEWGKALSTLGKTNAGGMYAIPIAFYKSLVMEYSPLRAFLLSFALRWMAGICGVMIMSLVNCLSKSKIGFIAAATVAIADISVADFFSIEMYRFSPVSISRLAVLNGENNQYLPDMSYGIGILAMLVAVLLAVTVALTRRMEMVPSTFE